MIEKIIHMWRWDTPQNFSLAFIDELEKQIFIKKDCWSGPIKNVRILIFTVLYFLKKIKKKPWRYHYFTPGYQISWWYNLWFMRYGVWQTRMKMKKLLEIPLLIHAYQKQKSGRIYSHLGPFFLRFYPITTWKINMFKKWKRSMEILCYTCVPAMTIIWCMVPEIWSATDRIFSYFGPFCPLPSQETQNIKILKKWRKALTEISSFYTSVS